MVKKQFVCALGAAVILGVCATASAGGQVHINYVDNTVSYNDSPDLALVIAGPSVSYGYNNQVDVGKSTYAVPNYEAGYVADVRLQGFLFCNHVDSSPQSMTYLVAHHDAWTYGASEPGTTAAVAGVMFVSYTNQALSLRADGTQCFQADKHGQAITDLHHIFVSGFDFGAVAANSSNTSAVTIAVDSIPAPSDTDGVFTYTITVKIGGQGATYNMGGMQPYMQSSTNYYLREAYDTNVFSNCTIPAPGTPQGPGVWASGTDQVTLQRVCHVRADPNHPGFNKNVLALDGTLPVVAAALFTGPGADPGPAPHEQYFGDNLAFGYPAVTPQ